MRLQCYRSCQIWTQKKNRSNWYYSIKKHSYNNISPLHQCSLSGQPRRIFHLYFHFNHCDSKLWLWKFIIIIYAQKITYFMLHICFFMGVWVRNIELRLWSMGETKPLDNLVNYEIWLVLLWKKNVPKGWLFLLFSQIKIVWI